MSHTDIVTKDTGIINWKRQDFAEKAKILNSRFQKLSTRDFLTTLFNNNEDIELPCVLASEKRIVIANGIDELISISCFRNDIYTAPASFFNNYRKTILLKTLYAICLDLDDITATSLPFVLKRIAKLSIKPTLLLNSGGGLHLYWFFKEPIECFNHKKIILRELIRKLYEKMQGCCKYQKLGLIQSFRVAGSLTKFGDISTGYQISGVCTMEDLEIMLKHRNNTLKKKLPPELPDNIEFLPNGSKKFYQHCLNRMTEVTKGNREFALFALAILAYKCHIPKEEVKKVLDFIANYYHNRDKVLPTADWFHINEVTKAIKGYNKKYLRVRSHQLEEWFGFSFPRKTKRNSRKQAEHLKRCRNVKNALQRNEKRTVIENYLKDNPNATVRQIIAHTGFSSTTICKYMKEIRS